MAVRGFQEAGNVLALEENHNQLLRQSEESSQTIPDIVLVSDAEIAAAKAGVQAVFAFAIACVAAGAMVIGASAILVRPRSR